MSVLMSAHLMPACIFSTITSSPKSLLPIPAASLCLLMSFKSPPPSVPLCPPGSAVSLPARCPPLCPSLVPVPAPLRCQRLSILTATAAPPLISLPLLHPSTLLTRWTALFYINTTLSSVAPSQAWVWSRRGLREPRKYQTPQRLRSFLEFCRTFPSIYVSFSVCITFIFIYFIHLSHCVSFCASIIPTSHQLSNGFDHYSPAGSPHLYSSGGSVSFMSGNAFPFFPSTSASSPTRSWSRPASALLPDHPPYCTLGSPMFPSSRVPSWKVCSRADDRPVSILLSIQQLYRFIFNL